MHIKTPSIDCSFNTYFDYQTQVDSAIEHQRPHLRKMESSTAPENSRLAHPDEQWKMHRNAWAHVVFNNPRLHPQVGRTPIPNEIDGADHAKEINDSDVFIWKQSTFNHKPFIRWGNMQRSIAIAIFSPTWGIFSRTPIWSPYLQVVNDAEEISISLKKIVIHLLLEGSNQKIPFFECHIYEPTFENMTEEYVKCAMQVKAEVIGLVRPVLTRFINYKFKVKPFKGTFIDNDEDGPVIEAQWIPDAERMVLAICRELKPDGSYGKIENLDWVDDVVIKHVQNVPLPDRDETIRRTESVFDDSRLCRVLQGSP